MADYCSNGGTVAAVAPSAAVNMGGTVTAVDAGTVGGGAYCGAAPPLPAVVEGKNGAAAGAGAGAVQNDGADEKAGKLLAPNPSNSMPQQQQRNTTAHRHDNAHHAEAVQQHCQPAAINHHHQCHHRNSAGTNGAGVPPPATALCQNGTEIEPPPQKQHEFGTAPNNNSNCFQPWLTDAEHHHHQFMHNFAMLSPPPFPMVVIPPMPTAAPFDYGSTLMPPAPPPPMAYPTPQGGRQSDLAARDEQQQQFFGTLYDSIAAVALAAGNGQFDPLMPSMMPTATTTYGDSSVPVPPPTDGSEENNNNDFYVYQHQLNIALGGHYPPPPIAALYPPGIEYGSSVDGEQQQHHHYGIDGGIANFELYTQHHPITPTTFLYPPIINGGGNGSGEHEYGSNNGFYTVGQHQLLHNQWKQSLAMAAVATVGKAAARAQNAGGGGHKRGSDGKPKTSNTSSSGHLTVPSTSRRSSSASTVKAHLSSATVSPVHSNGPAEYTSPADQFFPLLAQLGPAQRLTTAVVRDYLSNPARYDCVLWMYHAKVAQKSYGTEKRFFCPPPCIYLMGEGWRTRRKLLEQLYRHHHHHQNNYKSSPNASGDSSLANIDEREKFVELCASIVVGAESATTAADDKKQNEQTKQHHLLDFSNGKDYSAAKALHISDTDKRKYFHLNAHFGYACGALELGTFASQRIKIISKPSKKKQSMKSSDCKYLCVGNKSKIALFNRLRSQTVSTRYLHVDEKISTNQKMHEPPAFVASSTKWGAFHINVVDQPEFGGQQSQQQQQQHTVTYGSVIQLVDSQTEMRLPLMRIRKVDKQHVLLDPAGQGEPVSQLHKCAFQMVDVASNGAELFYLCLSQDKIIQFQAIQVDSHRHQISDGAAWTIISTDKAEYRWAEPLAANGSISPKPITPVPQLYSLNMLDASQKLMQVDNCRMTGSATIELNGTNFTPQLRVWFGATPAETIYCTKERLSCAVPSLYTVCKHLGCTVAEALAAHADSGGKLVVPLLLARDEDGILYPTPHTFPYQLQMPAVQSESSAATMNGGGGTAKICAADSSALAKNGGTLCSLEGTIPERFFAENRSNGIGEAQQLLMMHNAN